ncbi:MAG: hypothetical protein ABR567_07885, partial [Myxococcales bacterium]
AHVVVPEKVKEQRSAENIATTPILGDAALAEALGPPDLKPGSWAEYAIRTRGESDARVRFSILLPALDDGWYWLEEAGVNGDGLASAVKLRLHGDPSDPHNYDRMYVYVAGQAPIEVPIDQLPLPDPPKKGAGKVVKGRPERIEVRAGVYDKAEPLRLRDVRVWRSRQVPLWGLVKAESPRQTVELIAAGRTGAHSTFPTGWTDDQSQGKGSESMK